MSNNTGIEWTDSTWNPIRGCSRVSEGCRNCYAERAAYRFSGAGQPYEGLAQLVNGHAAWTGKVDLVEKHLLDPLKWKPVQYDYAPLGINAFHADGSHVRRERPRRIFVNSMSDLFHPNVPDEWIDRIFAVMALCPQHTFQILTKRPERMLAYVISQQRATPTARSARMQLTLMEMGRSKDVAWHWPLQNVHLGVSVEDQKTADERIPLLLQTPAAVRFISVEPLLGAIGLDNLGIVEGEPTEEDGELVYDGFRYNALTGEAWADDAGDLTGDCGMDGKLDWVICGGESGPGARPMHPDWARSLRDQCVAAGVPFFFKQWGEWVPFGRDFGGPGEAVSNDGRGNYSAAWSGDVDTRRGGPIAVSNDGRGNYSAAWSGDVDTRRVRGVGNADADAARGFCVRVGKKTAGSLLDGREWKEFPRT